MILQALCEQYNLLAKNHDDLPKQGCSAAKISFGLCLDNDGNLLNVMDLRIKEGNKTRPITMLVPEQSPRSGQNAPAYFLCDNTRYVLGYDEKLQQMFEDPPTEGEKLKEFEKLKKKIENSFSTFRKLQVEALGQDHPISKFLNKWNPQNIIDNPSFSPLLSDIKGSSNFVFYLEDENIYAHEDTEAKNNTFQSHDDEIVTGQCLITGKTDEICRIHDKIKGVLGGNPSGCTLVGFQDESFKSYGKDQSYNAPVGKKSMFQYTTVLNYMLANNAYHSRLNDITVVFWANKPGNYGSILKVLIPGSEDKEEATEYRNLAKDLVLALDQGRPLKHEEYDLDPNTEVYILGLAPNNARVAIAFWQINTFEFFVRRIAEHYDNLKICDGYDFLPIWRILNETVPKESKDKKISPVMSKTFTLSIFAGGLYPISLYQGIIKRVRADGDINAVRAAMIKAYLVRKYKIMNYKEAITVALNENDPNVGYQLGRLFAVLEKLQQDALGYNLNTTIKDRYFSSASSSPAAVFPQLLKLSLYHSAKAKSGGYWEKVKTDILDKVEHQFPQHLSLDNQGRFILGYYQQVKAIYTKKEED